jgi:S-(hydroxymethyl)glutathione dehydrogenase/alcohol dehydrogenase
MTISFSAAVFSAPHDPLTIETLTVDSEPPAGEVLVRLEASGVCHSDLHVANGEWAAPAPMVLGHEGAGVVEAVGAGVTGLEVGDHVVLSWTPSCGRCRYCVEGRPVLCSLANETAYQHLSFDGTTRLRRESDGAEVRSFLLSGTFGEYTVVPESAAIKIRKDAPMNVAALVGCAVTTGIGAVTNTAKLVPGSTAMVIGCGGVGLNILQGARLAGASQVIAVDMAPEKLELATKFGATATINAGETDVVEAVRELTDGGPDYAFEAIGRAKTIETAYQAIVRGGTAVVVGQVADGVRISIDPFVMSDQEKKLIGSNYGSSRPSIDFPRIIDLYMAGRVDLDSLVTRTIGLEDVDDALATMGQSGGIRTVIEYPAR